MGFQPGVLNPFLLKCGCLLYCKLNRNLLEIPTDGRLTSWLFIKCVGAQAAQTLFVVYIRDSIALRFEPFNV